MDVRTKSETEIKYRFSAIEIDKKNEVNAKKTLNHSLENINSEAIKQEIENRFKGVLDSSDFDKVIKVFNEKGLSKSIDYFMGIVDKDYCQIIISLLRNGTINAEETFCKYLPVIDAIPR